MKKRLSLIITLLLLFSFAVVSQAAAFSEVRYPDRPLNLRKARSPRAGWVGVLRPGQKVRIAWVKDGWAAVFEPWMTNENTVRVAGFANVKYLKKRPGEVEKEPWGEWMRSTTTLNVRSGPSRGEEKVGTLSPGTVIRADFPEDGWFAVFEARATIRSKMNAMGWVKGDYLDSASKPTPAAVKPEPAPRPTPKVVEAEPAPAPAVEEKVTPKQQPAPAGNGAWGKLLVAPMDLHLRSERRSGSHYATTIPKGETIRVDFLDKGWYAVFAPDAPVRKEGRALGYVLQRLVEPDGVKTKPVIMDKGDTGKKTIIIPRNPSAPVHRSEPKVDKRAHGFQYGIMERAESTMLGVPVETVKIYVKVDRLPKAEAMRDFATTLWKEYRKSGRELHLEIYVPEMDLDDLSFISAKYTYEKEIEFWARKAVLYGTRYLR